MLVDSLSRSDSDLSRLKPEDLELHLGELIRRYVRHRSADLAERVVESIEALYLHPDLKHDAERFCAYRRLGRHWRWLAQRAATAVH
ncbi:hypothetical protein THIOKS12890004 [Thiocapsa sp. KS1]|jgi:hypothetical protein|nr:ATP dependent RNA helicase [Thiocapsa sp. KS1]CRI66501.1 hypothetical protein THIOKS12890004 [Thiocapsa sp. KS1]